MAINLKFYGGVGEIGGNKILLDTGKTRVFLDFGMSFKRSNMFFSEFLQPRKSNGVGDFIEMGLLPDIKGIYRRDYLEHTGIKPREKPFVNGVLITHAHADHCAYVHHLRHDIPIYCSWETCAIMQAIEDTSQTGWTELINLKKSFQIRKRKTKEGFTRVKGKEAKIPRKIFMRKTFEIKEIKAEAIPVNHSLPGACGFIINSQGKTIVYTGDLRFHGWGGNLTKKFVEKAEKENPDILICEGTRIDETSIESEELVKERSKKVIESTKQLVIVNFPVRDLDRMKTFYEIAKETDRKLVISLKQAYLLELMKDSKYKYPTINDKHIRIFIPKKGWGIWKDQRFPEEIQLQDFDYWERSLLSHKHTVSWKEVSENQSEFILRNDIFELKELIDIKPKKGSSYIRSIVEPFDPEMEIEFERLKNWLKHFNLLPIHQIHCSGHANQIDLKKIIEVIAPKKVIPIHTEKPEIFKEIVPKGTKLEIIKKA